MVEPLQNILPHLTNPLALTGFVIFLLFGMYKYLVRKGVLHAVDAKTNSKVVTLLVKYGFYIAVLMVVFGYSLSFYKESKVNSAIYQPLYGFNTDKIIALANEHGITINAVNNMLRRLQYKNVPIGELPYRLNDIANEYLRMQALIRDAAPKSPQAKQKLDEAIMALSEVNIQDAESLYNASKQIDANNTEVGTSDLPRLLEKHELNSSSEAHNAIDMQSTPPEKKQKHSGKLNAERSDKSSLDVDNVEQSFRAYYLPRMLEISLSHSCDNWRDGDIYEAEGIYEFTKEDFKKGMAIQKNQDYYWDGLSILFIKFKFPSDCELKHTPDIFIDVNNKINRMGFIRVQKSKEFFIFAIPKITLFSAILFNFNLSVQVKWKIRYPNVGLFDKQVWHPSMLHTITGIINPSLN